MAISSTPPPAKDPPTEVTPEIAFRTALANGLVPKIYTNQFWNVVLANDFSIMFGHAGVPTAIVTMAYPLAKSLSVKLASALADYEAQTGTVVPTVEVAEQAIAAHTQRAKQ